MYTKTLATLLALTFSTCFAQAQTLTVPQPDNRYAAYNGPQTVWPTAAPDMSACKSGEYYEPSSNGLVKYFSPALAPKTRVQTHDECVWMLTLGNVWRYVLRPPGTVVGMDAQGRDMFDLGSGDGRVICTNPRPVSYEVTPPPVWTPPVVFKAPPPEKVVEPCADCSEVQMDWSGTPNKIRLGISVANTIRVTSRTGKFVSFSWEDVKGKVTAYGPSFRLTSYTVNQPGHYTLWLVATDAQGRVVRCPINFEALPAPPVELVVTVPPPPEKKHHKFPIPCIPREKNLYGIGWSAVGCAALAFGAYEVYEALNGAVIGTKIAIAVISPK